MSKVKFIESNRRTPDLAPLTDEFFSGLYDEILVNEIKMEGAVDPVAAASSPKAADEKAESLGRTRR
jgi:Sec7-like guanine-nucleotide exchange factor